MNYIWVPISISAVAALFLTIYWMNPSLVFGPAEYINVKAILITYPVALLCCAVPVFTICGIVCLVRWIIGRCSRDM